MGDPILTGILVIFRKKRKRLQHMARRKAGKRADLLQVCLPVSPVLAMFRVPLAPRMATR